MKKRNVTKRFLAMCMALCMIVTSITVTPKQTNAAGTYWLKVNRQRNTVTAYQYKNGKYTPVKAMVCSVGKNGATPKGNFRTQQKLRWHILMGNVWGQYCTRIYKGYLFHSVWYYSQNKNAQSTKQYNKLGKAASHGCVRLTVADSKWIYDNCSIGTKVTIYDSSNAGPLGKPTPIKVSTSKKMGWDPTDPDPANPYKKNKPTIKISSKKAKRVALYSSTYNVKSGVSAKSYTGKNLTSKIKVSGSVNTKKPGNYKLTYTVKDTNGISATKTFTVTVVKPSAPLLKNVKSSKTIKIGNGNVYINNLRDGILAVDRDGTVVTSHVRLSCDDSSVAISNTTGKARFTKPGTFKITYKITGYKRNGSKTTTKEMTVKVVDDSTPSIQINQSEQTISLGSEYGETQVLAGVSASTIKGTNLTGKLTYTITDTASGQQVSSVSTQKAGAYSIKYSVKSSTGRMASAVRTVKVEDLSAPMVVVPNKDTIVVSGQTKEEIENAIKQDVIFKTQKGTDLSGTWSYEIYAWNGTAAAGDPISIDKLVPEQTYRVYLYCTNPNTKEKSQKTEEASRLILFR